MAETSEYRIDELARRAGTTVRNVRAYQDRGLLRPPRRVGRTGMYTDAHLARLRIIARLLERGYTLANIGELIAAWQRGHDVGELLGLEQALVDPWSDEAPTYASLEDLSDLVGPEADTAALQAAIELGILEREGDRYRVRSPRLLNAGAEVVAAGVPLDAVLEHAHRLRRDVDRIAGEFVRLVAAHLFEEDRLPQPHEATKLADVVRRLRPLAKIIVEAELAAAMERQVQAHLGDRVDQLRHRLDRDDRAS